jgi:hypothetical protein
LHDLKGHRASLTRFDIIEIFVASCHA